jgi:hypothetical protein
LSGLSDYSRVDPEVLKAKAELGSNVHELSVAYDLYGADGMDPSWISEKAKPYMDAYALFRHETDFEPEPEWTETAMIVELYGMRLGLTPDRKGQLKGHHAVLELKTVEQPLDAWSIQTAFQGMAIFGVNQLDRTRRLALQLKKNGKYHLDFHSNNDRDKQVAIAALTTTYFRLDSGQRLWEKV